jgi:hypothetical protein
VSEWQPIETAPRDGTRILALVSEVGGHLTGRMFSVWHEGVTPSGFNHGWAVYPGFGGVDDNWFSHWMPLPEPPQ